MTPRGHVLVSILLVLAATGCQQALESPSQTATLVLKQGRLQGSVDDQGIFVFKGIPFAKPPTGARRWRPPEPPDPWDAPVLMATDFAPTCMQVDLMRWGEGRSTGSEDCLMLNIWTASLDPEANLPVLVFIHGGSHMSGSSSGAEVTGHPFYIGSDLARTGPAVVVTIAYRLGALGFVGHRGLSRESGYGGSGNYGYMDQIRALEWVRENIAQFGGDPDRVMLFGQSAGATGTLVLLTSARARGLFHAAIIHSMAAFTYPLQELERQGALLEGALQCANADPAAAIACMRARDAHAVTTALSSDAAMGGAGIVFGPGIDDFVLTATMMDVMRSGKQNDVPVIIGSTTDEFTTLAATMLPLTLSSQDEYDDAVAQYFSAIAPVVPAAAIRAAYPPDDYESRRAAVIAMVGDYVYTCPARMVARTLSNTHEAPVRRFVYSHVLSSPGWSQYGAGHGFELAFLFGPLPPQWGLTLSARERELATLLMRSWVAFARNGSPETPGGIAHWPPYDAARDRYLVIGIPPGQDAGFRSAQCDFWDRYETVLYP